MSSRFLAAGLCVLLAIATLSSAAEGNDLTYLDDDLVATHELPSPHHVQDFSRVFQRGQNFPAFANGYLISWKTKSSADVPANVTLWNRDGVIERSARVWLAGAKSMDLSHVSATPDGEIVAAGYAVLERGSVTYFVAKTDRSGKVARVAQTNPFVPLLVCAAADGTVWSLGRDLGKDDADEDYGILRQYSLTAGQLRELLPRQSFGSGQSPVRGRRTAFLRCSDNGVVAYVNSTHEYFEILDSGETVRRFNVEPPQRGSNRVESLAVLTDGSVFASIGDPGNEPRRRVCELQKDEGQRTASWAAVPGVGQSPEEALLEPPYGMLFGADGDSLVLSSKDEGLAWVRPRLRQP
jgi:hypothetical protein